MTPGVVGTVYDGTVATPAEHWDCVAAGATAATCVSGAGITGAQRVASAVNDISSLKAAVRTYPGSAAAVRVSAAGAVPDRVVPPTTTPTPVTE
jgi:hypothetical protein